MLKGLALIWITLLFLFTAGGLACQERPSADLLQGAAPDLPRVQRPETSLPDAPSPAEDATSPAKQSNSVNQAHLPLTVGKTFFAGPGEMRGAELGFLAAGTQPSSIDFQPVSAPKEPGEFWRKYLYAPPVKQDRGHHYASSFIARLSLAAAQAFISYDVPGRALPNTSYVLGVLSSAAIDSAYRPYREHSASVTFHDFGSTLGADAGMNVFHEFQPDIQRAMKSVTPKFVFRIQERIVGGHTQSKASTFPER